MPHFSLEILIILLLVLVNGLLAMSELAIVSARRIRLQQRAALGNTGAQVALELAETPNRFLSTVQIGITLVGILAGAFGGATLATTVSNALAEVPVLGRYSGVVGIFAVVLLITYLTLVIGELVPKRLALQHPESIASFVARPMRAMSVATAPVVGLLSVSTDAVLRALRLRPSDDPAVTEEDIRHMVAEGAEAGVVEEAEHEMVLSIFRLGDRAAGSLMTPRHRIIYLNIEDPPEENARRIADQPYTLFPVCKGNLDHVLGVATLSKLWSQLLHTGRVDVMAATEPAVFVPENIPVLKLTDLFKSSGRHKALVVDEFGVVQGIVTMTDVLEAIVGDLADVVTGDEPGAAMRDDGTWLIDGALSVDEFAALLDVDIFPEPEREYYQTLGGFVMTRLDRVPRITDAFDWDGLHFEVVDMDGHRVDKVLVSIVQSSDTLE
jgi:putative hemolysin